MSNTRRVQNNKNRNSLVDTIWPQGLLSISQSLCAHTPPPPQPSEVTPSPHTTAMTMQAPDLL